MFASKLHKNENGQAALETAIILIAFVVVASVFAFAILSAGSASTERGEQAIYSGLQGVQSSMEIKGAVIAEGASDAVTNIVFTVSPVAGGDAVNMADIVVGYRDETQFENNVTGVAYEDIVGDDDDLLEDGELVEFTVPLGGFTLGANTAFSLEVKPPTGGVLQINRTTPAAISAVMELR